MLVSWERRTVERLGLAGFTIALLAGLTYFLTLSIKRLRKTQIRCAKAKPSSPHCFAIHLFPNTLVRLDDGRFIDANDYWLNEYGCHVGDRWWGARRWSSTSGCIRMSARP